MNEATFTFRVDEGLKDEFSTAAKCRDRTGAQLLQVSGAAQGPVIKQGLLEGAEQQSVGRSLLGQHVVSFTVKCGPKFTAVQQQPQGAIQQRGCAAAESLVLSQRRPNGRRPRSGGGNPGGGDGLPQPQYLRGLQARIRRQLTEHLQL